MSLNFDPLTLNLVRGRRSHFVFCATFRNFWRSNTQLRKASNSQNPVPDDDSSMSSIGWAPWFFAGRIWHYRGAIISGADARCQKSTLPKMNLAGNKLPTNSVFDDVRLWHSASVASFPFQMECFQWHYLFFPSEVTIISIPFAWIKANKKRFLTPASYNKNPPNVELDRDCSPISANDAPKNRICLSRLRGQIGKYRTSQLNIPGAFPKYTSMRTYAPGHICGQNRNNWSYQRLKIPNKLGIIPNILVLVRRCMF